MTCNLIHLSEDTGCPTVRNILFYGNQNKPYLNIYCNSFCQVSFKMWLFVLLIAFSVPDLHAKLLDHSTENSSFEMVARKSVFANKKFSHITLPTFFCTYYLIFFYSISKDVHAKDLWVQNGLTRFTGPVTNLEPVGKKSRGRPTFWRFEVIVIHTIIRSGTGH